MISYKFYTDANRPVLEGKNIFVPDEYTLNYQCPEDVTRTFSPLTSFVFGTVELWFSIPLKQLLYVDGYTSVQSWKSAEIIPPQKLRKSVVMINSEENFQRGVSIKLMDDKQAIRTWNPSTGWLCVGPTDIPAQSESIEFAKDSIVILEKNQIHSMWLHISNFQEITPKSSAPDDAEVIRNTAMLQEQDLQEKFPQLVGFLMAFIFDRGTDNAFETARKYAQTRNPEVAQEIISNGKTLLQAKPFPWEFIQHASNDPQLSDATPETLQIWLKEIISILENNSKKNS